MESSGGAGIMLAVAAVLWLLYLVPTWLKRREYLSTERNAVRLQQTLRVLAETAELPQAVRVEASARSVAEQQRLLRLEAQRAQAIIRARNAAAARTAARQLAKTRPALAAAVSATGAAAMRLRRTRAFTGVVFLASVATVLVQLVLMATTGVSLGSWLVLGFAGFLGVSSFALLGRLASLSRARRRPIAVASHARTTDAAAPAPAASREWTPVPLPKPLYMSKPATAPPVMADPREHERRAAAAREHKLTPIAAAERSRLAARMPNAPATADHRDAPAGIHDRDAAIGTHDRGAPAGAHDREAEGTWSASRFAAMGHIDLGSGTTPDLDAALRRRRTG